MKRRLFLAGMLAALGPAPRLWAGPRPPRSPWITERLIAASGPGGEVGWAVLDATSGRFLEAGGSGLLMPPASTLKAVTALYALARLGAGHRFTTRVLRDGPRLILAGGGDPLLDSDGLADLARQAAAALAGDPAPPDRLEVWGGALPASSRIAPEQAEHLAYNPAISGLIVNFNRVHLQWDVAGGGPHFRVEARARRLSPVAGGITVTTAPQPAPVFTWAGEGDGEHWQVAAGAVRKPGSRWLPVRRPEALAGNLFRAFLREAGLQVGPARLRPDPPRGDEVARHDSPPLDEILRGMLKYSTNITAEAVGLAASGAADLTRSAAAMDAWLRAQGVTGAWRFADHSGLSADSAVSAAMMARVLSGPAHAQALAPLLGPPHAAGWTDPGGATVLVKSGTLNFVSNLVGYAAPAGGDTDGRRIVFAILSRDPDRHRQTRGQERPPGTAAWVGRAHDMQARLVGHWLDAWGWPAQQDHRAGGVGPHDGVARWP